MNVMQNMHNLMKPIPSEIKILYDALLVKRGVPLTVHFYYRKWLKYYLDFCFKYHHDKSKAVSIFYGIKNTDLGKIDVLKNKKANISTKKLVEFFAEKFMDCL